MNNSRNKGRKALLALIVIAVVCALALACTACSLFVSAFGVNVNGINLQSIVKEATQDDTGSKTEDDTSSGNETHFTDLSDLEKEEESGDEDEPAVTPEDPKPEDPTDPPEEEDETPARLTITSSLTFDKASEENFNITATHEGYSLASTTGLLGAGMTSSTWRMRSNSVGASNIYILRSYLFTLDVGSYDLYYILQDGSDNLYYEPFTIEIVNSHCRPTDLKIDYDINCKGATSDVYVTWHCDCNKKHTVAFDGNGQVVPAGVREFKIAANVDKSSVHTAQVQCYGSPETQLNVTKAKPAKSVVDGSYLANTFSFMGKVADRYIEDFDELVFAYQYIAYEGSDTNLAVALGPTVLDEIGDTTLETYLGKVNNELVVPWSFSIGFSLLDNIATLSVQNVVGGNSISSGFTSSVTYDSTAFTSHYVDQGGSRTTLPIDAKTAVPVRNTKELLAVVEAGYKPSITDATLNTLYNKARTVCSRYITNDMSDVKKLHVIYDYLAGEIVYDDSTLELYSLINSISAMPIDQAKARIDEKLNGPCKFSESMRTVVQTARNNATSTEELYAMLYNSYLQKLSAFSIEGVFNDKAAVCEGISYAFMLLARIEGIECYQVSGKAVQNGNPVSHAWNKVILEGTCYCVDATWGSISAFSNKRFVSHRYFLLDDASMYSSHVEELSQDVKGIEFLATGNFDYYKSVSIGGGHTLYVSNKADLIAVANYYADAGSLYLEMQIDPSYSKDSDVMSALQSAYKTFESYSSSASENGVYSLYVVK